MTERNERAKYSFPLSLVLLVTKLFLTVFSIFIVSNLCWLLSGLYLFHLLRFSLQESLIHIPLPSFFSHGQLSLKFCSPWKLSDSAQVYCYLWLSSVCPYLTWTGQNCQLHSSCSLILNASSWSLKNSLVWVQCLELSWEGFKSWNNTLLTGWIPWGIAHKLKFFAMIFCFIC